MNKIIKKSCGKLINKCLIKQIFDIMQCSYIRTNTNKAIQSSIGDGQEFIKTRQPFDLDDAFKEREKRKKRKKR